MGSPYSQNSLFGSDSSTSWITSWPKPMVLWSSSGPSPDSRISYSIGCLTQHPVQKQNIIGNDTSRQMVAKIVQALNHSVDFVLFVGNDDLEWTKKLG
jgi:hypothetical protein